LHAAEGARVGFHEGVQWRLDRARVFKHFSLVVTLHKIKDENLSFNPHEDPVRPDIRLVTVDNA